MNWEEFEMSEFLTTAGISYKLDELIKNSIDKLYLISPYLQVAKSKNWYIKKDYSSGVSSDAKYSSYVCPLV